MKTTTPEPSNHRTIEPTNESTNEGTVVQEEKKEKEEGAGHPTTQPASPEHRIGPIRYTAAREKRSENFPFLFRRTRTCLRLERAGSCSVGR